MSDISTNQWQFGEFRLDANRKVLKHGDKRVPMPLKELEVLSALVRCKGELVTKDELLNEVWENSFVDESNLSRHIYLLRKTLRDLGSDGLIENIPRRGYRFTGEVQTFAADEILVEKRTQTRARIEFQDEGPRRSRMSYRSAFFIALALILCSTAFFGYRYSLPTGPAEIRSLAVLPFKVVGDGAASSHAGVGLADILTTRLTNVRNIQLRPASSAIGLEDQDPVSTGKHLQVDAVLEGSIYYFSERVRVTAKLIRVSDSSVVWAGEFEKLKKDEMQIQNDLALQIVPALAVSLSGGERAALAKQYTQNAEALELYLKGRYEWNKRSLPGMIEAQRLFRNAIAADPAFSLAYVGLADTLLTSQPSRYEAAMLISKALEMDPHMAEAHASHGFYLMFMEWRWDEAEAAFKRSIDLNPNYATAHHWYATLLGIKGETDAAKAEMHRALEINPISHNFLADLGQLYYFSGDYERAQEFCLKALEIHPDFAFAHEYLHYIYLKTGEFEKAVRELGKADKINDVFEHASYRSNAESKAEAAFKDSGIRDYLEHRYPGIPYEPSAFYLYAKKHAFLGENDKALDYLERSTDTRQFLSVFLKADPLFEQLHSEPRYQKILQKMGLVGR